MRKADLIGRRIVGVEYERTWDPGRGEWVHLESGLLLDNGTFVAFHAEETDLGEYGVTIQVIKKKRRSK